MLQRRSSPLTLRDRPLRAHWLSLIASTLLCGGLLALAHLSAALLLGAMLAAIIVATLDARIAVPAWSYAFAQAFIGCLIARSFDFTILRELTAHWPIFLFGIMSVTVFSTLLGGALARMQVLPGTTAVWGSAPGAATVMTLMAESFGGDVRLVAFMQFLRVVLVVIVASVVARMWTSHGGGTPAPMVWFPAISPGAFAATLALAGGGAALGTLTKIPAGALLFPLVLAMIVSSQQLFELTLPPWLLAICYVIVGWSIGLRFTREVVVYAARAFPKVALAIFALITLCGGLACVLHWIAGIDPLTAYLATSPGGADSVAIIAAGAKVDLPFVMAMQTGRFIFVVLTGPTLARVVAHWTTRAAAQNGVSMRRRS